MHKFFLKLVVILFVFTGTIIPAGFAFAQLDVPVSDTANGLGGIAGMAANGAATGALETIEKANFTSCTVPEQAFLKSDKVISAGFGGLALIGGGAALQAQILKKVTQIEVFKTCHLAQLQLAKNIPTLNIYSAEKKQILTDEITKQILSLEGREEPLAHQMKLAQQGFWKVLTFNILVRTTKSVANNLVKKLVSNYRIQDYAAYADAMATQVYDNKFIQKNYQGDNETQLLVRSMLTNPLARNKIQQAVYSRADAAVGFDPDKLDYSDPNFYNKMAVVGSGEANPFLQQTVLADQADEVHAQALLTAQQEISLSNGMKTPYDCPGVLSQQQSIDYSYKAANDQLADRRALLTSLLSAQTSGRPVNQDDIKQAATDVNAAQTQLSALPGKFSSPAIDICKTIVSPASLIDKGIDKAFGEISKNMGTYNDNNLPFFMTFISDVANQIGNSLIFGNNINSSQLLSENMGNLAKGTDLSLRFAASGSQTQQNNNLSLFSSRTDSGDDPNSATFDVQWDASGVSGDPTYVIISGPGLSSNINNQKQSVSGDLTITISGPATFTVNAYDKSNKKLATTGIDLSPQAGETRGAYAARPAQHIRGDVGIRPRGPE